jgi:uncharacterized repeat protein (TIGR03803 family)
VTNLRIRIGSVPAVAVLFCLMATVTSSAQTFTTLASFNGANGRTPDSSLVQGFDGNLYGTTINGGASDAGTIFKITPSGTLTTIYSFCAQTNCTDGYSPFAGLVLADDGSFYGVTSTGGANCCGTVFKITADGTLTTIYSFCAQAGCSDGESPIAALIQGRDGALYGTTPYGGTGLKDCGEGGTACGVVFKITMDGKLTTLHSFCDQTGCPDGDAPAGSLLQANNGSFYGTTPYGGATGHGVIFRITSDGKFATIFSFDGTRGGQPEDGLIQAASGNFYGTTYKGGGHRRAGAVFEFAPVGRYTELYPFCSQTGCKDGAQPVAGVVQATDGNFYGTTKQGGTHSRGTVFKLTSSGTLTPLHSFDLSDGTEPNGLFQATDGSLYGTTPYGGTSEDGTVFKLNVGLGPFIETLPTSGKVQATVEILGTNLTSTTAVTFNGTAAAFTIVSSSQIKATVPNGATTGFVTVTTSAGNLKSNTKFQVIP